MTISLDEISRKKLILIRQIFQRAKLQAESEHSNVDRIMALIGFDLATETALKTVISSLSTKKEKEGTFHQIIESANKCLGEKELPEIPDEANIRRVHDFRNDAQHQAKYPNETDLSDFRTYTRDFLNKLVSQIWGEDFESISFIDAIQDVLTRKILNKGSVLFKEKNYTDVGIAGMAAFDCCMRRARSKILTERSNYQPFDWFEEKSLDFKRLSEEIDELRNILIWKAIGIDVDSYRKYQSATRGLSVHWFGPDEWRSGPIFGRTPTKTEANYILDFVCNLAVQVDNI